MKDNRESIAALIKLRLGATLVVGLTACGPSLTPPESDAGTSEAPAACTDRGETYVAGMATTGLEGAIVVMLADASPSPPDVGLNTWVIRVEDNAGVAIAGETITARAWMPDHGHGPAPATASAEPAAGEYELGALDFFMSGFWEVTIEVGPADDLRDSATFGFCAEG